MCPEAAISTSASQLNVFLSLKWEPIAMSESKTHHSNSNERRREEAAGPAPASEDGPPGCGQSPPAPLRLCRQPLPPAVSGEVRAWEGDPEAERVRVAEKMREAGGRRPPHGAARRSGSQRARAPALCGQR